MNLFFRKQTFLIPVVVMLITISASSQVNQWTWMSGDNTVNHKGVYGAQGVTSSSNKPGARQFGTSWKDAPNDDLWLFGGLGYAVDGYGGLNDLWKYNVSTKVWTWIKGDSIRNVSGIYGTQGISDSSNKPGARAYTSSWTDSSGNLWLFGGIGNNPQILGQTTNDLWKFCVANKQWTWIKGSNLGDEYATYGTQGMSANTNKPGGRHSGVSWTDNFDNLWLFGGRGLVENGGYGDLNDLWKYNILSNQWTWVKGDKITFQSGLYGTRGTPTSSTKPGSRVNAISWVDLLGNFWLFGGYSNYNGRYFNDLWKYNQTTNQWTWMSGDTLQNQFGKYGTQSISSPLNKPGARAYAVSWTDAYGNLWLFGGTGYASYNPSNNNAYYLNDLWRYNINSGEWTWIKGDTTINPSAVYGTQGVPASSNKPGARRSALSFTDYMGNLWLFGGVDFNTGGYLNDLWRYSPLSDCIPHTWTGYLDSNWNNAGNWCDNLIPSLNDNVIIPSTNKQPYLNVTSTTVGNLTLNGKLYLNNHSLTVKGAIIGTGTLSGTALSDLIIYGNSGTLKFSSDGGILHSLKVENGAVVNIDTGLIITGQ